MLPAAPLPDPSDAVSSFVAQPGALAVVGDWAEGAGLIAGADGAGAVTVMVTVGRAGGLGDDPQPASRPAALESAAAASVHVYDHPRPVPPPSECRVPVCEGLSALRSYGDGS